MKTKFKDFISENVKDILIGKTKEEINRTIGNMSNVQKYLNIHIPDMYRPTMEEVGDQLDKVLGDDDILYNDDLDEAMYNLQGIIGVTDGFVCSMYFTKYADDDKYWKNATTDERKKIIDEYLYTERLYAT